MKSAFICYSKDSDEHVEWVCQLADRLRNIGLDVRMDLTDIQPGKDHVMKAKELISSSDYVLVVVTEMLGRKVSEGTGFVSLEIRICTECAVRGHPQPVFVPVLRSGSFEENAPPFLSCISAIDMTKDEDYEKNLALLVHRLWPEADHKTQLRKEPRREAAETAGIRAILTHLNPAHSPYYFIVLAAGVSVTLLAQTGVVLQAWRFQCAFWTIWVTVLACVMASCVSKSRYSSVASFRPQITFVRSLGLATAVICTVFVAASGSSDWTFFVGWAACIIQTAVFLLFLVAEPVVAPSEKPNVVEFCLVTTILLASATWNLYWPDFFTNTNEEDVFRHLLVARCQYVLWFVSIVIWIRRLFSHFVRIEVRPIR
jgi:hypothetical protein